MHQNANLAKRLRDGEKKAFEELLDRFGPRIQNLARRYAGSETDAEDLTQEIFVSIFKSIASFRGESDLTTWLTRLAFNHCLRWKEKHDREGRSVEAIENHEMELPCPNRASDPAKRQGEKELSNQVHAAISGLSEAHREIITLHELHGLTYAQCAEVLQIPVGTVKSRLSNAFSQMRSALRPYVLNEDSVSTSKPLSPKSAGGMP